MNASPTAAWLAGHELRLSWRDFMSMVTAGRRRRLRTVIAILLIFVVVMHIVALPLVGPYADAAASADKASLVAVTGMLLLCCSLLLSQAMESVTRVFYSRSDLDLILTAPVEPRQVFSVRIAQIAVSVSLLAMLLAAPFIDVAAFRGGARWLLAYGVVAALGAAAAAIAVALTIALFRIIGAKRTRLIAQIVAAVIGAAFVIGLQVAAILSYGNLSRFAPLQSEWLIAHAPDAGSALWLPARAALGDPLALALVAAAGLALLMLAIMIFAPRFGEHALAAAGVGRGAVQQPRKAAAFRSASAQSVLRRKEWTLLRRDPWLMSQTLMQILYLLPPAILLWRDFRADIEGFILLVPVLVMAAGQLGGGLAWLSISGEDAPDLIASAPLAPARVMRAKIEAVMGAVALVFAPFVLAMVLAWPVAAAVAGAGVLIAAGASTAIQFFFRTQARRSHFRRRHTSSRIATFAEAFSSIAWAATSAMALAGTWLAAVPAGIAFVILFGARALSGQTAARP